MFRRHQSDESQMSRSRRQLLQYGTCGAMGSTTFLSTMLNLRLTSSALAAAPVPTSGYKALVCIFLNGAIDGFQVLTPFGDTTGDQDFANYAASRSNMSLKREDPSNPGNAGNGWDTAGQAAGATYGYLQQITDSATGKKYGIHPRFTHLKNLYNAGKATFVANVGALADPIANKTEYAQVSKRKPVGLFSHSDLQRHWQTGVPMSRNQAKGWGGRMADLLTDPTSQNNLNVYTSAYSAISLLGRNIWQTGTTTTPYAVSTAGAVLLDGYAKPGTTEYNALQTYDKDASDIQNDFINHQYADLLEKSINVARTSAREAGESFNTAYNAAQLPTTLPGGGAVTPFGTGSLGTQLQSVARVIKQRAQLGQNRQIFMVQVGGWDHHANLLQNQNSMIPGIDTGIKAFHDFLSAEGILNDVCTFTISDFGRTISSNGIGTDHAWGSNMIVMGGALNTSGGPRIWGTYPQILMGTNSILDTSTRGTYIPTTSTDAFHAEFCRWMGIANGSYLEAVLPNIRRFYGAGASGNPMGFLNI
jgi:uncharacterized protein (DUF1501 family)